MSKSKEIVKGYKAFNPDMTCRNFQYEFGKTYIHVGEVSLCNSGFHFCEYPFDVWNYYSNDILNQQYAEVEGTGTLKKDEDKICCSELTIKSKLKLADLIKFQLDLVFKNCKKEEKESGYSGQIANSGDYGQMANSGNGGKMANSGDFGKMANSGYGGRMANSGDFGQMASVGTDAVLESSGENTLVAGLGVRNKVKAIKDNYIVLVDWQYIDYEWAITEIYRAKVGKHKIKGIKIEPDTWYWFEKGLLMSEK